MTIDEAIAHAREVAEEHREKCTQGDCDRLSKCIKCAEEHEQLAKWLEELKQYRAIGLTPNMVKEMIKSEQEATHYALIHDAMLKQYEEIGTVEECRAAVEKQKAKKPKEYEDKFYGCPSCGNVLLHKWEKYNTKLMDKKNGLPCCLSCGQKIDWSDEE